MPSTAALTPLILIVDDQDISLRSLENILRPKGHVVLKAFTHQQALDLSSKVSPDAILVARDLPDCDGIDLIRQLKDASTVRDTTPILVTAQASLGKAERLEALGAGAWDVLEHPIDPNELILRLDTYVRAKQEADRVRDESLTDASTGFYNVRGVLKRARELTADSSRTNRPVTCIALGTQHQDINDERDLAARVRKALEDVTRVSDMIGSLSEREFVVVAPGTDNDGAVRLSDRILEALQRDLPEQPVADELVQSVRAGFYSFAPGSDTSAEDLLLRATMALRRAQQDDGSFRIRAYDA